MCGIAGFVNYKKDLPNKKNILNNMVQTLKQRGPDEEGLYLNKNVALGHKRLIVIDPLGGKQPMIEKFSLGEYVIVYNGQIYNTEELKNTLSENGFTFYSRSDTEVLLKAYIYYGKDVAKHLNGIFAFAIWNSKTEELFMAREHFVFKPLFYTQFDEALIFASELKSIFEYPNMQKIIDGQGISELFGIGPAHTPGFTVYKDIFEIKPGHFAVYNKSGLHIEQYWKLKSKQHTEDFEETCLHLETLLKDAISRQLVSDMPICTFLSGGLDSSIITKFTADYLKEQGLRPLDTYSVDYVDNDKNFVKSDFQPNSDNYYIDLMNNNTYSKHHQVLLDTPELAKALEDAMIARDMPGMADIDSYDTAEKRRISYLTITWFMQTLLDRADRMSMANGFETRVPFCDYRLAQYMYNVPWEMKAYKGREKGILRYIMKDYLPDEIVNRKKSPYPKTHNPTYLKAVKSMLTTIMKDSSSPINYILNRDYILDILNTDGKAFTRPWFGQLMTGPQLMAYLCQVNMWLERYQPKIKL